VYQLRGLLYVAPYPSTFSFAMTFVCLWLQTTMLRAGDPPLWRYGVLAVLIALVFASHPFTGAFAVGALGLLALFHPGAEVKTRLISMVAMAAGLLLAELWPYYSVFQVTLGVSGGEAQNWVEAGKFEWSARPRRLLGHPFYNPARVLGALGPALAGIVCLGFMARRREHWFVVIGGLIMMAVYFINLVYRIPLGHRFLLFALFFFHLSMVWAVLECLGGLSRGRRSGSIPAMTKLASVCLGAVVLGALAFNIAFVRADFRHHVENWNPVPDRVGKIVRSVPRTGVVMAPPMLAWPIPTFSGKVVSLFHPNPMVPDAGERKRNVAAFFDTATPAAERTRILRRYGVSHVLIDTADTPAALLSFLNSVGVIEESLGRLRLVSIRAYRS
jgi:hypothetical protein